MTARVFVDTNVLVYARDASEPEKQPAAARWLEQLWIEQRGRTSIQVLNEYYVTVTRNLRPGMEPDEAWRDVDALLAWEPQVIDAVLLRRARDLERRHERQRRCRELDRRGHERHTDHDPQRGQEAAKAMRHDGSQRRAGAFDDYKEHVESTVTVMMAPSATEDSP